MLKRTQISNKLQRSLLSAISSLFLCVTGVACGGESEGGDTERLSWLELERSNNRPAQPTSYAHVQAEIRPDSVDPGPKWSDPGLITLYPNGDLFSRANNLEGGGTLDQTTMQKLHGVFGSTMLPIYESKKLPAEADLTSPTDGTAIYRVKVSSGTEGNPETLLDGYWRFPSGDPQTDAMLNEVEALLDLQLNTK